MEFKDRYEEQAYWRKRDEDYERSKGLELKFPANELHPTTTVHVDRILRTLMTKNGKLEDSARLVISSFELKQFFIDQGFDAERLIDNGGSLSSAFGSNRIKNFQPKQIPSFEIRCIDSRSEEEIEEEWNEDRQSKNKKFTAIVAILWIAACVGLTVIFGLNPAASWKIYTSITIFAWGIYFIIQRNSR